MYQAARTTKKDNSPMARKTGSKRPQKKAGKKNAAGIDPNLYVTTGLPKPIPKAIKIGKTSARYEIILMNLGSHAFTTQKLEFKASRNIARAWTEAVRIRDLLVSAGNKRKRDFKIIAFGVKGALTAYQQEYAIKITEDCDSLRQAVKQIIQRGVE